MKNLNYMSMIWYGKFYFSISVIHFLFQSTGELMFQEVGAFSVAWNTECEVRTSILLPFYIL